MSGKGTLVAVLVVGALLFVLYTSRSSVTGQYVPASTAAGGTTLVSGLVALGAGVGSALFGQKATPANGTQTPATSPASAQGGYSPNNLNFGNPAQPGGGTWINKDTYVAT